MSLRNVIKKIKLEDETVLMTLDMITIEYFKRVTGKSFLTSITQMQDMDEEILFPLFGGMLRSEEDPTEPLGVKFLYQYNPFAIIEVLTPYLYELLDSAMPKGGTKAKGKTKKK